MDTIVTNKRIVAEDIIRLRLACGDGRALTAFLPGAHIELQFAGFSRRYSLTSCSDDLSFYEICVLRTRPSRGGSAFLHEQLQLGDRLKVLGPYNSFPLNLNAAHSVFFAGGIGITPFLNMLQALDNAGQSFELHYAARDHARFLNLPSTNHSKVFRYVNAGGHPGLDVDAVLTTLDINTELYVCGPRSLIEAVRTRAIEYGWPQKRVHFESFGTVLNLTDRPVTVRLVNSGLTLNARPEQTLLETLLNRGIWSHYECRRGECGACFTEVLAGTPDHRDLCLSETQRRIGMCTCVSWSKTPELTLNL